MNIGRSGGIPGMHPPTGSNSFIFAYVFTKKHTCQQLVPLQQVGAPLMKNPGSATDEVYTVCNQVDLDVLVYIIEN